jgi:hypothetical protein
MSEIYVSTDIEADGPIPGPHSMLSLGSAAFDTDGQMLDTFSANLELLEGASGHPETMAWWATQPEAWAAARESPRPIGEAMTAYCEWLEALPGDPVFVAYPAAYDFMFVAWYLVRFAGRNPFSHSALDVKTFAMALLGTEYRRTGKREMPERWFDERALSHVAVDDAIGQGRLFCNMRAEWLAAR